MTHRAEHRKTEIEMAIEEVAMSLFHATTVAYERNRVPITLKQFRRIVAGYFENKTMKDWLEFFGDPDDEATT